MGTLTDDGRICPKGLQTVQDCKRWAGTFQKIGRAVILMDVACLMQKVAYMVVPSGLDNADNLN